MVKDVLKGVDTAQEVLLPQGSLKPGQAALILLQYEPPADYEPDLQSSPEVQPVILVWPMDSAGKLDTHGIPGQSRSGRFLPADTSGINSDLIKKDIATSSPEEVGLYHQVLDAWLFPNKFQMLSRQGAKRATYVRLVIAILDVNRDVSSLAQLLESQDSLVRSAALQRLEALTGTTVPTPQNESRRSLREWSQTWATHPAASASPLRWPPVPADLKAPPDAFPKPLVQALQDEDAGKFSKAFADWLDSGVMRDREIEYASILDRDIVQGSNLAGATGLRAYLPPAPRLRPDIIFNRGIPAVERIKAIALFALIIHYNRFAHERAEANARVASAAIDSDILRRAAFWELRDANTNTAGRIALKRLVQDDADESTQRFLLGLCLNFHLDDDALDVARAEIRAKHQTVDDGLFAYLTTHRDDKAQWIARLFCQEGQKQVVPVLLDWLKDSDAQVRQSAALNLCWFPSTDAVLHLLDAIQSERDPTVRDQMLIALAQTGDRRGLETLLTAAHDSHDPYVESEIARGLGRIGDNQALAPLADIVEGKTSASKAAENRARILPDAINAFGYISHLYEAHIPDRFQTSSGTSDAQVKLDVERIAQWRKSQTNK
jgi:HEAT repeat protein